MSQTTPPEDGTPPQQQDADAPAADPTADVWMPAEPPSPEATQSITQPPTQALPTTDPAGAHVPPPPPAPADATPWSSPAPASPPADPLAPSAPPATNPYATPSAPNPYATPSATPPPPPAAPGSAYGQQPYGQGTAYGQPQSYGQSTAYGQSGSDDPAAGTTAAYGQQPYGQAPGYGAAPGYAYPGYGSPYQTPPSSTNVSAIVLLVLSIIGTMCACLTLIPAGVLAIVALTKQSTDRPRSNRLTGYGWISFAIGLVVAITALVFVVAIAASRESTY